jgi:exopolyphosphatase / guanosine-5'-triphosphate,3'-diphosphate pyrophosphatase
VRDASNQEEFADAVRSHAGSELEVVSGEREAELSFLGATYGLDADVALGPYLVLDIGGGSTELVVGTEPGRVLHALSTQMGSVRLTERYIRHDPPVEAEVLALRSAVSDVLDDVERVFPVEGISTMIAVAGTATTIQALALGLDRYDPEAIHRTRITREAVEAFLRDLARMTNAERAALPVMAPGRGDVIVAGAAILVTVMSAFNFERALVSETDILDGLAFEMLGVR